MYRLVEEFDRKPVLPAPFVLFETLWRLARLACGFGRGGASVLSRNKHVTAAEADLQFFQEMCMSALTAKREAEAATKVENTVKRIDERTSRMESKGDLNLRLGPLEERMANLETLLSTLLKK